MHQILLKIISKTEMLQYLEASDRYQSAPKYRGMDYSFANIHDQCPVCGKKDCARWRGYYLRNIYCPEMAFIGKIAIHCGECRNQKKRFSMAPDFLSLTSGLASQALRDLVRFGLRNGGLIEFAMS